MELPLQEPNKLGGRVEQLFDASRHRQTLAGTLGLRALCAVMKRRITQNNNQTKVYSLGMHKRSESEVNI